MSFGPIPQRNKLADASIIDTMPHSATCNDLMQAADAIEKDHPYSKIFARRMKLAIDEAKTIKDASMMKDALELIRDAINHHKKIFIDDRESFLDSVKLDVIRYQTMR